MGKHTPEQRQNERALEELMAEVRMKIQAMEGIASAEPGSVKRLVEVAKTIDSMTPKTYSHDYLIVLVRDLQELAKGALSAIHVEGGAA